MNYRYSSAIIPVSIIIHLLIINGTLFLLTPETYAKLSSIIYYNLGWLFITLELDFYPTRRKEKFMTNFRKVLRLYSIYGLFYFVLFVFEDFGAVSIRYQVFVFAILCMLLLLYRVFFYWTRSTYRLVGGNFVRVVAIGRDGNLKKIRKVFDDPNLGYRYVGFFDEKPSKSPTYLGKIEESFLFILENHIDEIYCIASKFSQKELQNLISFADNNLIKFKVIPDNKDIFTRAMTIEMYDDVPVLNIRKVPLDTEYAKLTKRTFDIVFSTLVIVFVLSWLTPVLFICTRLESRGPLFFKQKRNGLKRRPFWCYKFRSMTIDADANTKMASKNDQRVTKVGKFIRKTSIDELPQFFNVFIGSMSVVGPRPHMEYHTIGYEGSVDKYLVRHFVKPGITGLAQIRGYRGEITKSSDIINRIRLDIFYVEKWSIWFDIKIIFLTISNAFKGEEKAY